MGKEEKKRELARITKNSYNFYVWKPMACVFDNMIAKVNSFIMLDKEIYPGLSHIEIEELKDKRIGLYKRYAYKIQRKNEE